MDACKNMCAKKQRETILFIWMEVLVFAQDKHNIHLKKNKQNKNSVSCDFLGTHWVSGHYLYVQTRLNKKGQ